MRNLIFFVTILLLFSSCEEEFTPEISSLPPDIVVEGYIEAGDQPLPPYVILTKSIPFFTTIDANDLENVFVHDANVTVSNGAEIVTLTEVCINELPPNQRAIVGDLFGVDIDSTSVNICVYIDLSVSMLGEVGKTYDLKIETDNRTITSSTTLVPAVPLDSLIFRDVPGFPIDTMRELRVYINDPINELNYYRYFTRLNGGPQLTWFNSVVDDQFFDGQSFEFPLPLGQAPFGDFDPNTVGFYTVGDTIEIKWSNISQVNFDFWSTLEFNTANQGPFSTYTRVDTNIEGGLGVWGGYTSRFYDLIVE